MLRTEMSSIGTVTTVTFYFQTLHFYYPFVVESTCGRVVDKHLK